MVKKSLSELQSKISQPHLIQTVHNMKTKNGLWFVEEGALPAFSVSDVLHGLESHPDILVRTQTINEEGEKTVLSRAASIETS